jgi:hypothetical protein
MVDPTDAGAVGDAIAESITDDDLDAASIAEIDQTVDAFAKGFSDSQLDLPPRGQWGMESPGNPSAPLPFSEQDTYDAGYVLGANDYTDSGGDKVWPSSAEEERQIDERIERDRKLLEWATGHAEGPDEEGKNNTPRVPELRIPENIVE